MFQNIIMGALAVFIMLPVDGFMFHWSAFGAAVWLGSGAIVIAVSAMLDIRRNARR